MGGACACSSTCASITLSRRRRAGTRARRGRALPSAEGRTRTCTGIAPQGILSRRADADTRTHQHTSRTGAATWRPFFFLPCAPFSPVCPMGRAQNGHTTEGREMADSRPHDHLPAGALRGRPELDPPIQQAIRLSGREPKLLRYIPTEHLRAHLSWLAMGGSHRQRKVRAALAAELARRTA